MSGHTLCHEDGRKVGSQTTALHGCSKLRGNSYVLVAGQEQWEFVTAPCFSFMLFHHGVWVISAFTEEVALWPYMWIKHIGIHYPELPFVNSSSIPDISRPRPHSASVCLHHPAVLGPNLPETQGTSRGKFLHGADILGAQVPMVPRVSCKVFCSYR